MEITDAAQAVQKSAFPDAYADHEQDGRAIASAMSGNSKAAFTCVVDEPDVDEESDASQRPHAAGQCGPPPAGPSVRRILPMGGFADGRREQRPHGGVSPLRRTRHRHLLPAGDSGEQARGLGGGALPRRQRRPARHRSCDLRRPDLDRRGQSEDGWRDYHPTDADGAGKATPSSWNTATTSTSTSPRPSRQERRRADLRRVRRSR